jgi:hypothetical protein
MTTRELLDMYGGGARQASSDVNFLIRKLNRDLLLAQQEDKQLKKNIKSAGKTALGGIKTRREFLLAKRFKPDLTFKEFLLDPKTAGQYMLEGSRKIASGESSPLTLRETFGIPQRASNVSIVDDGMVNVQEGFGKTTTPSFGTRNAYDSFTLGPPNPERVRSGVMLEQARSKARSSVPSANADIMPDVEVESIIPPPPMGDVSSQGLQNVLGAGRKPLPSALMGDVEGTLPEGVTRISGNKASQETIDKAMQEASKRLEGAEGVSSGLGTAGKALGAIGSLSSLGSGLSNIAQGRGDLSNVSGAASGAAGLASAAGFVNPLLGVGLGLLSLISKRRR